ncbi:MAG: hypothetical protein FJ293_16965, partial [Planctomycetes bacterium]|nr:hypothetical protein [Planctomycetota bacterium]
MGRVYGERLRRAAGLCVAAAAAGAPLLPSFAQDGSGVRRPPREPGRDGATRDDESLDVGPAQSRFEGATVPAALALVDGARERSDPQLIPLPDGGAWLLLSEHEVPL